MTTATTLERKLTDISEWLGTGSVNIFGRPFAGKDTQADKLASYLGVEPISSGEVLRNSHLPDDIRAAMNRGELIPTDHFRDAVVPYLGQAAFRNRPLILSSVGRMIGEEAGIIAASEAVDHPIKVVPYLEVTEDEALRRLAERPSRGREDDTLERLMLRFEEYSAKTIPVLEVYEAMGLLVTVDALDEKEVVFRSMVHQIHELVRAS